jgi:hypothetical protein
MNTSSIHPIRTSSGHRIVETLARWIQHWTDAIDAAPPVSGHRMGSWEASISPSAHAAFQTMRVSEAQKDS